MPSGGKLESSEKVHEQFAFASLTFEELEIGLHLELPFVEPV